MEQVISIDTIDLLLKSFNIKSDILESNKNRVKKLIENKLLLSNISYKIKETNELVQPIKNSNNTKQNIDNLVNIEYSYNPTDKIMKKIEKIENSPELLEIVTTITNNILDNKVSIQSNEYPLDDSQYYVFNDLVNNLLLQLKNEYDLSAFCEDLLKNEYYFMEFLKNKMGINEAEFLKEKSVKGFILSYIFLFSYLIFPTQQIDNQLYLFPKKYKDQLYKKYFKNNSKFLYNTKKIFRGILAIPGVIISPLIYKIAINALQNLS